MTACDEKELVNAEVQNCTHTERQRASQQWASPKALFLKLSLLFSSHGVGNKKTHIDGFSACSHHLLSQGKAGLEVSES